MILLTLIKIDDKNYKLSLIIALACPYDTNFYFIFALILCTGSVCERDAAFLGRRRRNPGVVSGKAV